VNLQEERICIFGALHDTQSGRVDIERSRADVGLDKLLQMSVIEVIQLDCKCNSVHRGEQI